MSIEYMKDFKEVEAMPSPRIFQTHLPFSYLPTKHVQNRYKIVYINRNPKDRFVSLYTWYKGKMGFPPWSWSEFFNETVLNGKY